MTGVLVAVAARAATWLVTVGASGGVFGFVSGSLGAISPTTYRDHGGTSRTITRVSATDDGAGTYTIALAMDGTPPNSDTTFAALTVNGTRYTRASATYSSLGGGVQQWAWTLSANSVGTSGTARVRIA